MLGHKTNLRDFKGIKMIQNMFSDLKRIKLKTTNKNISGRIPKWQKKKLNTTSLNNTWIKKKKSQEKLENISNWIKMQIQIYI